MICNQDVTSGSKKYVIKHPIISELLCGCPDERRLISDCFQLVFWGFMQVFFTEDLFFCPDIKSKNQASKTASLQDSYADFFQSIYTFIHIFALATIINAILWKQRSPPVIKYLKPPKISCPLTAPTLLSCM